MSLNLLIKYNKLLELNALSENGRKKSLLRVFNRDFEQKQNYFNKKLVTPTPIDGEIKMSTLFNHLTTVVIDKATKKREYDRHRAVRLHWVKHHLDGRKKENMYIFSVKEPEGFRTYIYDKDEKYVVVFRAIEKKE